MDSGRLVTIEVDASRDLDITGRTTGARLLPTGRVIIARAGVGAGLALLQVFVVTALGSRLAALLDVRFARSRSGGVALLAQIALVAFRGRRLALLRDVGVVCLGRGRFALLRGVLIFGLGRGRFTLLRGVRVVGLCSGRLALLHGIPVVRLGRRRLALFTTGRIVHLCARCLALLHGAAVGGLVVSGACLGRLCLGFFGRRHVLLALQLVVGLRLCAAERQERRNCGRRHGCQKIRSHGGTSG